MTSVSSYNLASKYLADSDDESSGRKSAPLESSQQASKEWAAVSVSDADRHFSSENGSSYGAFDLYQTEVSHGMIYMQNIKLAAKTSNSGQNSVFLRC